MGKEKCFMCNKKITLVEMITAKCKCGNYYCPSDKMPENHNCTFDYIKENQDRLEKKLIKLTSDKNIAIMG